MHRCMLIFRKRRQSETYLDTSNRPHPTLLSGRLSVILCPRLCSQLEWGQGRLVVINLAKSMQKTRFQERRSSCVPGALQHRPAEKWTRLDLTYSSSSNSTIVTEARHDNRFHRLLLRDRQIYSQLGASTDGIIHRKQDSKPRYVHPGKSWGFKKFKCCALHGWAQSLHYFCMGFRQHQIYWTMLIFAI